MNYLKWWNRKTFGDVLKKKKCIQARIAGAEKVLAATPNDFLINLQKSLVAEYLKVLKHEEMLWALKSGVNWIVEGECDTKFFHITTMVRHKRNKILGLNDNLGN